MRKQHTIILWGIVCLSLITYVYIQYKKTDSVPDSKLPISAGILTYYAPKTLKHTLQTYKDSGFMDCIDDLFVVIQKSDRQQREIEVCKAMNVRYIPLKTNGHMASGFKAIYQYARNDILLFLENDFVTYTSKKEVKEFLWNSIYFLHKGCDIVRGRSRINAGVPNYSYQNDRNKSKDILVNSSHLSESIYWEQEPEKVYPSKIKKVEPLVGHQHWYTSSSKSCNYTNNPYVCKREFFKYAILPHLIDKENIEDRLTSIWSKQNYTCVFGPGLFTHDRSYDGHD